MVKKKLMHDTLEAENSSRRGDKNRYFCVQQYIQQLRSQLFYTLLLFCLWIEPKAETM